MSAAAAASALGRTSSAACQSPGDGPGGASHRTRRACALAAHTHPSAVLWRRLAAIPGVCGRRNRALGLNQSFQHPAATGLPLLQRLSSVPHYTPARVLAAERRADADPRVLCCAPPCLACCAVEVSPFWGIEKASVLQEARCFNDSQLDARKCQQARLGRTTALLPSP